MPRRRSLWSRVAAAVIAIVVGGTAAAVNSSTASAATVDTNAWYVLINRNSGKALDVYNLSTADGARITQWSRNDGNQQQWQFVDSGGGYYRLKSRLSGKVLDVNGASTANGAAIIQWSDHNGTNQQFRLADSSGGYVRLINRNSNRVMEVQNASTADGGNIVQYDDHGGNNQQWQLVQIGGTNPTPTPTPTATPTPTPSGPGGTYNNPVVWQDFPDVDIIRVGDAYYMSSSTFHYSPGAPILRSYDLVNWEFAGHSVPTLDFGNKYSMVGDRAYVDGIWASAFGHRPSNNQFYWLGCIDFARTYVYSSSTVEGPWQRRS
ncbi:RICIN domain-containing protein, partial [Sphaerisporangium rubeum]